MPFGIDYPFDPADIMPIWELEQNEVEMKKGYDDEDDDDETEDGTDERD